MALTRTTTHSTSADGTFSVSGAATWNASHTNAISGADVGGLVFCPTATSEATTPNLTWAEATGQGLKMVAGTAITDVAAMSLTRTNNNAAVATGVKWTYTDTTSAAGFMPFQILGGAGGSTNLLSLSKAGALTTGGTITGTTISSLGDVGVAAGNWLFWLNRGQFSCPADSQFLLQNYAANNFDRLMFGGTSSSFPALKRNGTSLEVKLADDSAYAPIAIGNSLNSVSPTSPNRTVTIVVGGTTIYLHGKTTND